MHFIITRHITQADPSNGQILCVLRPQRICSRSDHHSVPSRLPASVTVLALLRHQGEQSQEPFFPTCRQILLCPSRAPAKTESASSSPHTVTGCRHRSKLRSRQPVLPRRQFYARFARASLCPHKSRSRSASERHSVSAGSVRKPFCPSVPSVRRLCRLRRSYPYILFISLFLPIRKVIEETFTTCTQCLFPFPRLKAQCNGFQSTRSCDGATCATQEPCRAEISSCLTESNGYFRREQSAMRR